MRERERYWPRFFRAAAILLIFCTFKKQTCTTPHRIHNFTQTKKTNYGKNIQVGSENFKASPLHAYSTHSRMYTKECIELIKYIIILLINWNFICERYVYFCANALQSFSRLESLTNFFYYYFLLYFSAQFVRIHACVKRELIIASF